MGMAASQARLLTITSRIHDVEYQAQMIQSAKMQLALREDEIYRRYNEALDATTLTFQDMKGNRVQANFNNLCGLGSIDNNIGTNKHYVFRDSSDRLIVPSEIYDTYQNEDPFQYAMKMVTGADNFDSEEYASVLNAYTLSNKDASNGNLTMMQQMIHSIRHYGNVINDEDFKNIIKMEVDRKIQSDEHIKKMYMNAPKPKFYI